MSGNWSSASLSPLEMIIHGVDAGHVVRMDVCENDLAHDPSCGDQIVDAACQGNLFVFIRRTGIDHQDLAGVVNQITVSVSGRGLCRRAHRKANVVGMELDATCRLPTCL